MRIYVELKADIPDGKRLRRVAVECGNELTANEAAEQIIEVLLKQGLDVRYLV